MLESPKRTNVCAVCNDHHCNPNTTFATCGRKDRSLHEHLVLWMVDIKERATHRMQFGIAEGGERSSVTSSLTATARSPTLKDGRRVRQA